MRAWVALFLVACGSRTGVLDEVGGPALPSPDASTDAATVTEASASVEAAAETSSTACTPIVFGWNGDNPGGSCGAKGAWSCGGTGYKVDCTCGIGGNDPACTCSRSSGGVTSTVTELSDAGCSCYTTTSDTIAAQCGFPQ
jgi:hypothetical protein